MHPRAPRSDTGEPQVAAEATVQLEAAHLAGATAVALLGVFAVDMPHGYLGPSETTTLVGYTITAGVILGALAAATTILLSPRAARVLVPSLYAAMAGIFIPPVADDPVMAGAVAAWQLYRLAHWLIAAPTRTDLLEGPAADRIEAWRRRAGPAARHLLTVSVFAAVLVVGYRAGQVVESTLICLGLDALALAWSARWLRHLVVQRRRSGWLVVTLLALAVASASRPAVSLSLLAAAQLVLLLSLAAATATARDLVRHFLAAPALLISTSFVLLIATGTLFLSFPAATIHDRPIAPVDALFTATSAACVTGLVVLDTGADLSIFGQVVVLLLIQAGGLSIMTLSAFAALLLGSRLGLRGELTLGEVLDQRAGRTTERLVSFIVFSTVVLEGLGAVVLGLRLRQHGASPAEAAWEGVFHSVSGFCNAGFALWSDSLVGFAGDWLVVTTIAVLIVLGGLGFPVLLALWSSGGRPWRAARDPQVRMVLAWSGGLIAFGALWFLLADGARSLSGLSPGGRVVHAIFQSITTRTAGFNSIDLAALGPATVLVVVVLMFIGASPGGTGGGIKTTTTAVLLGAIPTILRRERRVVIADRTIPLETVFRSAAITTLALLLVVGGTLALLLTQSLPFESLLFEAVSAFGTVGLSLGVTPHLDTAGRLVVIALMFLGRVGPLTLALLLGRGRPRRVEYPEARIMVG